MSDAQDTTDGIWPNQKVTLRASKWLQLFVLLDVDEMTHLLKALEPLQMYFTGTLVERGTGRLLNDDFLAVYEKYVTGLKTGSLVEESVYRSAFSTLWTCSADQLAIQPIDQDQQIIRAAHPVIQLRPHRFAYSPFDGQFRSMVLGPESISWGIQFAYPQIVQDPLTQEIETATAMTKFPNTLRFRALQQWIRRHTRPTPFLVADRRVNVPIRLGHACFAWINQHPQLHEHALQVKVPQ